MNILLLGNGFDLYHKLPTRYDNFLNTVDFLIKNYTTKTNTIATVFGDEKLQSKDRFISQCYSKHREVYEHISLDEEKISEMISLAKNNIWFSYLLQSFNSAIGWIDLEQEIAYVLDSFKEFFDSTSLKFNIAKKVPSVGYRYVIGQFDFFLSKVERTGDWSAPTHQVKEEYIITIPTNSKNTIVDKEKIIFELLKNLNDFTKILKLYLQCFIEPTLYGIKEKSLNRCPAITHIDKAITFNYTNSYECFYFNNPIFHIHGNVNNKIILGINSDESDQLENIDTSFVKFKKYFQRTQYDTDLDYINWVGELNHPNEIITLTVMGHSLDITDKDIIVELFRKMNEINILYNTSEAKSTYIANLIKMFGKEELDILRKQRKLNFLSLDMDFTDFIKRRKETSYGRILEMLSEIQIV